MGNSNASMATRKSDILKTSGPKERIKTEGVMHVSDAEKELIEAKIKLSLQGEKQNIEDQRNIKLSGEQSSEPPSPREMTDENKENTETTNGCSTSQTSQGIVSPVGKKKQKIRFEQPVDFMAPKLRRKVKLIVDTDIGSDVDDALALLVLLHIPPEDLMLLGITTVYGDTILRAKIVEKILSEYYKHEDDCVDGDASPSSITPSNSSDLLTDPTRIDIRKRRKKSDVPQVIPGRGKPMGSSYQNVWKTGLEGVGVFETEQEIENLKREQERFDKSLSVDNAARFIISKVKEFPNEVVICCLGPLTNVARALQLDPSIATMIKRVVVMGVGTRLTTQEDRTIVFPDPNEQIKPGKAYPHYPSHNLLCDSVAALEVFQNSQLHLQIITNGVTNKLWFESDATKRLLQTVEPIEVAMVGKMMKLWLEYRSKMFHQQIEGTCPHDPLTIAESIYPGRFISKYLQGTVVLHEWELFSSFITEPCGKHQFSVDIDSSSFMDWFEKNLF